MTPAAIRNKLHNYVDKGDEKFIKLMYAVAKEYNADNETYPFSAEDFELFELRRSKRLSGESTLHSWKEAKEIIKSKKVV